MSQPPPDMPPPTYGSVPHQPAPRPAQVLFQRRYFRLPLIMASLGFGALAVSEVLALIAYSRGSLVVVRAGQWQHIGAAFGYGMISLALFIAAWQAD